MTYPISSELKDAFFDGMGYGIVFGQDATAEYDQLPATLDELVIYSKALTAEDIANLKTYYQAERAN